MRVRRQTWAIAAIFLLAFCWLGVAAVKCAPIYQGLEVRLPVDTRFASAYGAVVFPLLGAVAAAALILFDVFLPRRWVQGVLMALFATFLIWAFRALLFIPVSIGPATQANEASAVDGGIRLSANSGRASVLSIDTCQQGWSALGAAREWRLPDPGAIRAGGADVGSIVRTDACSD